LEFFYIFECARWRISKLFEAPKAIDHGQKNYNDPLLTV
jgi:hypothetical protein